MKIRILSEELAEKAKIELNEDPKTIHEEIRNLKEWLLKQPHLKARQDDQWLVGFIRGCKHSLEKAKQKLDMYYTVRTLTPEMCRIEPDDPNLRHILESGIVLPLQTLDISGARICISRVGSYNPNVYCINDVSKVYSVFTEMILMEDDDAMVSGATGVVDCGDLSLAHASQYTPTVLKKMIALYMNSLPLRTKTIHILNAPSFFEPILNLAKLMLSEKIGNRFFIYGKSWDNFYKLVPKDRLPVEYGGTSSSIDEIKKHWLSKLDQYHDWFSKDGEYGTDEKKRSGQPKDIESLFGVAGSFKRLNVD